MGLQETSIHSTTVLQPCVKIIIMIKRQSFGDYKRDGLSHVSMLMVTIVNQRHKSTAAMNSSVTVYFYQDELLKVENLTPYCQLRLQVGRQLSAKVMHQTNVSHFINKPYVWCKLNQMHVSCRQHCWRRLEALVKFTHLHYSSPVPAVPPTVSYCGPSAHCFYHCEK